MADAKDAARYRFLRDFIPLSDWEEFAWGCINRDESVDDAVDELIAKEKAKNG